jgi:hypothetical protein
MLELHAVSAGLKLAPPPETPTVPESNQRTVLESDVPTTQSRPQAAGSGAVSAIRSCSAKSLWCRNLAESQKIRATFQRDSSRRHSEVRVLPPQPGFK